MTNLILHGHVCSIHGSTQKELIQSNLKTKYGVNNVSQINWVKEKKKETCRKNFGVNYPMQSQEIMHKSKKTLLKLYGVDNISKVPEIIQKIQKSLFEIDTDLGMSKIDFARLKRIETNKEKYGVPYYFQSDDAKHKIKSVMMEKYGVDNYSKTSEFKQFLLDSGLKTDPNTLSELQLYYKRVKNYTERSYRKYKSLLCKSFPRSNNYHIDHIYSISDGFKHKIDEKIIGSIANLQVLPEKINKQKNAQSWVTIERLTELYNKLSDDDKFSLD